MQSHATRIFGANYDDHPLEYFWRVDSTCIFTMKGEPDPAMHFSRWSILRRTPHGVWLIPIELKVGSSKSVQERNKKLVLVNAVRAYAYPTKKLAFSSFLIRQEHRIGHAAVALERAEAVYALARNEKMKGTFE